MSATADKLLVLARSQLGVAESPPDSNDVEYNTEYYGHAVSGSQYSWCCVFQWWLFLHAGAPELFYGGGKCASCTELMNYAKENGLFVTPDYRPGDLVLYDWDDSGDADHVGIIETINADGTITTIEGNVGDNGGTVTRETRSLEHVRGAYRPAYDKGDNMSTIKGIDCSVPVTADTAKQLADAGYKFVCRYTVPEVDGNGEPYAKRLTINEAKAISDAGLLILSIYETAAGRALIGATAGAEDGASALKVAESLGVPHGACIFFAVDTNAQGDALPFVLDYFQNAHEQLGGKYLLGVYGSHDVCEYLVSHGVGDVLWQTYAWSDGKLPEHATVYQYKNGQTVYGISADLDEAYSPAGMWSLSAAEPSEADAAKKWGVDSGIFKGDGNGNYDWPSAMTREELAIALYRYSRMK